MLQARYVFLLLSSLFVFSLGCGGDKAPEIIEGPVMDNGGMSEEEVNFSQPAEETAGGY
ncbi:hypothetical protein CA13_22140 [Planctomycetes bacterium CA13]|uniref:Secreted protein n=1 Tax=Novipirellula herctigrandis TaxID=2527986 RepID=A0A5C5Z065_9BACT|nr:hypothetical protein CA13_22140 [Planctomycetes bacterium CA13]